MSSSHKSNINNNGSGNSSRRKKNKRSVRFDDAAAAPAPQASEQRPAQGHIIGRRIKRPRIERPNEDEDDDVDDWQEDDDGEEHVGATSKQLLDAKRSRRLKHEGFDDDDDDDNNGEETQVDASTSLMADEDDNDEIPVEPFNMNAERTDGQGYFDGETYVFRKRDVDEEPDAWLEGLADQKKPANSKQNEESSASGEDVADDEENKMDDWNREELYAKLLPLVSDTETIVQALVRYGELIKRQRTNDKTSSTSSSSATKMAQQALNDLTEASNALLLKGDVDIYEKTRKDLLKLLPSQDASSDKTSPGEMVKWEYKGNQDGKIHGPYTTQDMQSWIQAGYFVGTQAVQVRTVIDKKNNDSKVTAQKPTVDDLLSDLMDDDDVEEDKKQDGRQQQPPDRGEWMSSNDVDFSYSLSKTS